MLLKDKGYDEFLAKKIERSREDSKAGRVLTLEESKARTLRVLSQKIREVEQATLENEKTIYG